MDKQVIFNQFRIRQHLSTLFSDENHYFGISRKDYERLSGQHPFQALLVYESITDIANFNRQLAKSIIAISQHKPCSAILMIETHPLFLRVSDLSSIADALEGSGVDRFQNGIAFNAQRQTVSANADLFILFG